VAMGDPTGEADRGALRLDFDRRLLRFRGSAITSDAGLLTYRELDDTLRLTDTGADTLADARTGKNGRHQLAGLLRQSVLGRLAGGADGVVVMVAFVPHREELAAVARRAGRPCALRRAGNGRLRQVAAYKTDQIEESGQHEVLNWFCLLGAMEALGRKPDKAVFLENWAFVSPVVFAHYHA
jgi:hypothetical protein